eukprot:scaffold119270_cov48-Phaeocystis_antarctica.AAC.2
MRTCAGAGPGVGLGSAHLQHQLVCVCGLPGCSPVTPRLRPWAPQAHVPASSPNPSPNPNPNPSPNAPASSRRRAPPRRSSQSPHLTSPPRPAPPAPG